MILAALAAQAIAGVQGLAARQGLALPLERAGALLGLADGAGGLPAPAGGWCGPLPEDAAALLSQLEGALPPEGAGRVQIFTPPEVAGWLAERAVRRRSDRVLDPAAGTGRLLLAAGARLVDELKATPQAALEQLMGIERDPATALVARAGLVGWALERGVVPARAPQIVCADALVTPLPPCEAALLNPPYHNADVLSGATHAALAARLPCYHRQVDQSVLFLALAADALTPGGALAALTSRYWLEAARADNFRQQLASRFTLRSVLDLGETALWPGVQVLTALLELRAEAPEAGSCFTAARLRAPASPLELPLPSGVTFSVAQGGLGARPWALCPPSEAAALRAMEAAPLRLGDWFQLGQGLKTGHNATFVLGEEAARALPAGMLHPTVSARHIQAFGLAPSGQRLLLVLNRDDPGEDAALLAHLERHRAALEARYQVRAGVARWYALSVPQGLELMRQPVKLLAPLYARGNRFAVDRAGHYVRTDAWALVPRGVLPVPLEAIAAALNGAPLSRFALSTAKLKRDGYYEYSRRTLEGLPLPWTLGGEPLPGSPEGLTGRLTQLGAALGSGEASAADRAALDQLMEEVWSPAPG